MKQLSVVNHEVWLVLTFKLNVEMFHIMQVREAFGASTWPLPNDKTATTPAVVIFKDKDISK